jgi:hypothetical protein
MIHLSPTMETVIGARMNATGGRDRRQDARTQTTDGKVEKAAVDAVTDWGGRCTGQKRGLTLGESFAAVMLEGGLRRAGEK